MLFSGQGTEITYDKLDQGANFSISTQSREIEFVITLNLNPIQTVEAISEHIKLGELATNLKNERVLQSSAFGYYLTMHDLQKSQTVSDFIKKIQLPIDGIILTNQDLNQSKAFSFDEEKFDANTLKVINERNLSVFGIGYTGIPMDGRFDKELQLSDIRLRTSTYEPYTRTNRYGKLYYLDFTRPESYLIYNLIDYFSSRWLGGSSQNTVGFSIKQSQPQFNSKSCYQDEESVYFIKPGDINIQCGTIGMVYRYSGWTEKLVHNLVDLAEQIVYSHAQQVRQGDIPLPLLVDGTSLGSGKLQNVMRLLDYYKLEEKELATLQLQSMSILGLPQIGVKYQITNLNFDKLKQQALSSIYTSAPSALNYDLELDKEQVSQIRKIMSVKYALTAYIRTNVYLQREYGTPFIRPLFFDFEGIDIDSTISNSYMFGSSIIAFSDQNYSSKMFPKSSWFSAEDLSDARMGFSEIPPDSSIDGKQMVFLHQGTITPIYSIDREGIQGSSALKYSDLDLHIFTNEQFTSKGSLLIENAKEICIIKMEMANDTIIFSQCNSFVEFTGYDMRHLYLYKYHDLTNGTGYESALINNEIKLELVKEKSDENIGTFRTKKQKLSLVYIQNITFNRPQIISVSKTF